MTRVATDHDAHARAGAADEHLWVFQIVINKTINIDLDLKFIEGSRKGNFLSCSLVGIYNLKNSTAKLKKFMEILYD